MKDWMHRVDLELHFKVTGKQNYTYCYLKAVLSLETGLSHDLDTPVIVLQKIFFRFSMIKSTHYAITSTVRVGMGQFEKTPEY